MVSSLGDCGVVSFSYHLGVLPSTCDRNQRKYMKLGVTETFPPRGTRSVRADGICARKKRMHWQKAGLGRGMEVRSVSEHRAMRMGILWGELLCVEIKSNGERGFQVFPVGTRSSSNISPIKYLNKN